MRILFLHGWTSVPGGIKPTYLKDAGHEVVNPALDDDDFDLAVRTAQAGYDQHKPDVIVGSSRGGAVGVNMQSNDTPLVLLCPAWKNWGTVATVKSNTIILHARTHEPEAHDLIAFADPRFVFRGFDLIETEGSISALSNCGGFSKAFSTTDLSEYGLLADHGEALDVQQLLLSDYPDEHHAVCDVWAIWQMAA